MRDYSGIVMNLRFLAADLETAYDSERGESLYSKAADAIEELLAKDKNVPGKNVGEWIAVQSNGERFFRCSRCGAFLKESFFNLGYSVNYCPNCGAAMMEVINDA